MPNFPPNLMGVYETIRSYQGHFIFLEYHQQRLEQSCMDMGLPTPNLHTLLQPYRNNRDIRLRFTLLCDGSHRIETQALPCWNQRFLYHEEWSYQYVQGARKYPHWKHLDTQQLQLRNKARQNGYHEIILLDEKGYITEGSISNVFFIDKQTILTPSRNILPGTCRKFIVERCASSGITLIEREFLPKHVQHMTVFFTNAIRGIVSTCTPPPILEYLIKQCTTYILQQISLDEE